jgi:hypothetical protein
MAIICVVALQSRGKPGLGPAADSLSLLVQGK